MRAASARRVFVAYLRVFRFSSEGDSCTRAIQSVNLIERYTVAVSATLNHQPARHVARPVLKPISFNLISYGGQKMSASMVICFLFIVVLVFVVYAVADLVSAVIVGVSPKGAIKVFRRSA